MANFKTYRKSYKNKKLIENPKENWLIIENTHEPIVSQHDFDLVQELRKNKRRRQNCGTINSFSSMVYCADCGNTFYLGRGKHVSPTQEHMMCSTYAHDSDECTAHYIRTVVLSEIIIGELNKLLTFVKKREDEFMKMAVENASTVQADELKKAEKSLKQAEKRIAELDKLFIKLYEDNVSGKIFDARFEMMSKTYKDEQEKLKSDFSELSAFVERTKKKNSDTMKFVEIVRKYEKITELTPEIMHELIEKIVVHAQEGGSTNRTQQVDIYFRFNVAMSTAVADFRNYYARRKAV